MNASRKGYPIIQTYNDKDKNLMLTQLPTKLLYGLAEAGHHWAIYHPHYKEKLEMTKSAYNPSLLRPTRKRISLLGASSHCTVEVVNPLHNVPEASTTRFAIYHPHYKDKLVGNPTRKFVCTANCLYFLRGWSNLLAVFFLAHDSGAYTAEPGLVTKKGEPPRISLHLLSRLPSLPSLLFSLTLSKMRPAISKCSAMSKCATIFEWQLSLPALANFPLLADCPSVKLTNEEAIKGTKIMTKDCGNLTSTQYLPETSFDPSLAAQIAAQTVEFSPDNIALLNKRLQRQTTNKSRQLLHVKLDPQDTHLQIGYVICVANITNKVNIIDWLSITCKQMTKVKWIHRHHNAADSMTKARAPLTLKTQLYEIVRTGEYGTCKHGIGKYGSGEYKHLAFFKELPVSVHS